MHVLELAVVGTDDLDRGQGVAADMGSGATRSRGRIWLLHHVTTPERTTGSSVSAAGGAESGAMAKKVDVGFMKFVYTDDEWAREVKDRTDCLISAPPPLQI